MAVEKFTPIQKERLKRLEPGLINAVAKGDLKLIKSIISDLQTIYLSTGNTAKLLMAKNRWYEAEMEHGNLNFAEIGLIGVRTKASKSTRVYLEASTLLAICYLRQHEIRKAEPIIREVLVNDSVIKSDERRAEFRRLVIDRFDEETVLYALTIERVKEIIEDVPQLVNDASGLAASYSEEELYAKLGAVTPRAAKDALFQVDSFSKNLLPSAERLKLPGPTVIKEDKKVGHTVFSSFKRVLYKSLCDKDGDLFKKIDGGILTIQTSLAVAITELFKTINIGLRVVIVGIAAIVFKLGLQLYCEHFKPVDIMEIR